MLNTIQDFYFFFKTFWKFSNRRRKLSYFLLIFLMSVTAFAEVISIGAVVPFIGIIIDTEKFSNYFLIKLIISYLNIPQDNIKVFFGAFFLFFVLISTILKTINNWYVAIISNLAGAEIGKETFKLILNQNYQFHLESNSNFFVSTLTKKIDICVNSISSLLILFSSLITLTTVILFFSILYFKIAMPIIVIGFLGYFYLMIKVRKRLKKNSMLISSNQDNIAKILTESFEGIKEIIINNIDQYYYKYYYENEYMVRRSRSINTFISTVPRYIIEFFIIFILITIALYLDSSKYSLIYYLPTLGLFIIGAQRTLPLLQISYWAVSYLTGSYESLKDLVNILNLEIKFKNTNKASLNLTKSIKIENVSFTYVNNTKNIIDNLNFEIKKNTFIAIIGKSGSGKSTLIELIMGLLSPVKGKIYIDDEELNSNNLDLWYKKIAYVPQKIFLSDSSFAENIAHGENIKNINFERIKECCDKVGMHNFIISKENGYRTKVGERGNNLSGGQLQRIGIARALYKNPQVLFLDEITSALDKNSEVEIINLIKNLSENKTIVLITHKIEIAEQSDKILNLEKINKKL